MRISDYTELAGKLKKMEEHSRLIGRLRLVKAYRQHGESWRQVFNRVNSTWVGWVKNPQSLMTIFCRHRKEL